MPEAATPVPAQPESSPKLRLAFENLPTTARFARQVHNAAQDAACLTPARRQARRWSCQTPKSSPMACCATLKPGTQGTQIQEQQIA